MFSMLWDLGRGAVLLACGWGFATWQGFRRERREALLAALVAQRSAVQTFHKLAQQASRADLLAERVDERRAEYMAFQAQLAFVFGGDAIAREAIEVLLALEDEREKWGEPRRESEAANAAFYDVSARMSDVVRVTERALRLPVVEVGPASPVVAKAAGRGKRWGLIADVLGRAQAAAPALPEHARTTPPKLLPAGTDEEK